MHAACISTEQEFPKHVLRMYWFSKEGVKSDHCYLYEVRCGGPCKAVSPPRQQDMLVYGLLTILLIPSNALRQQKVTSLVIVQCQSCISICSLILYRKGFVYSILTNDQVPIELKGDPAIMTAQEPQAPDVIVLALSDRHISGNCSWGYFAIDALEKLVLCFLKEKKRNWGLLLWIQALANFSCQQRMGTETLERTLPYTRLIKVCFGKSHWQWALWVSNATDFLALLALIMLLIHRISHICGLCNAASFTQLVPQTADVLEHSKIKRELSLNFRHWCWLSRPVWNWKTGGLRPHKQRKPERGEIHSNPGSPHARLWYWYSVGWTYMKRTTKLETSGDTWVSVLNVALMWNLEECHQEHCCAGWPTIVASKMSRKHASSHCYRKNHDVKEVRLHPKVHAASPSWAWHPHKH